MVANFFYLGIFLGLNWLNIEICLGIIRLVFKVLSLVSRKINLLYFLNFFFFNILVQFRSLGRVGSASIFIVTILKLICKNKIMLAFV